jgi:succinyl-diaminopimelate desuccinylase
MRKRRTDDEKATNRQNLLSDMIGIDSTTGRESALAEMLAKRLSAAGIDSKLEPVDDSRVNLVACLPGKTPKNRLVYNAHLDTVPVGEGWTKAPFGAEVVDGKLYGRGASDTKSSLAAMASVMIELAQANTVLEHDLVLLCTAGEEKDMAGARAYVASGGMQGAGCLVVGEPTNHLGIAGNLEVVNTTKGCLIGDLRTKGISSHGAKPEEGLNAVLLMTDYLAWLKNNPPYERYGSDPDLGRPTWAPTIIQGGKAGNVIPDFCETVLDLRPIPGMSEEDALRPLREAAQTLWGDAWEQRIKISGRFFLPPLRCEPGHPVLKKALDVAADCGITSHLRRFFGASDVSYLCADPMMPFFIFGPGIESQAHKADEWLWLDDYLSGVDFYLEFALRYGRE